jgi:hypothetical protein
MKNKNRGLAAFVAILVAPLGATSSWAQLQIIESNVPGMVVGQRVDNIDEMHLPAGGRVKVIVLPANETKVFNGPELIQGQMKYSPFGGTRGISIQEPEK